MSLLKIIINIFLSLFITVGVFWLSEDSYYVINTEENLCWDFTKWSSWNSNWLPDNWEAIFLTPEKENNFLEDISCLESDVANCCVSQWYRYAWIPIWVEYISDDRKWAEVLGSKSIIETKSFNPSDYNLIENISRKEMMKIIMNISEIVIADNCREIFTDVQADWWCKYIESALENDFITWNQMFRPDDSITKTEALKLIFKSQRIEKLYNTNSWQEDYISTAYYKWLIDEKYTNYNQLATRWWIFSVAGKTFPEFSKY
jgi:hypothetical protein